MYFAVYALDKPGSAAIRAENRPAHRARLRQHDHPVKARIGGPLTDEAGAMIGTLLVIEAETRAAVEAFMAGDPYAAAGLYASVEIRPFAWGLGAPAGE
jgi:uncharacterized protein YciI